MAAPLSPQPSSRVDGSAESVIDFKVKPEKVVTEREIVLERFCSSLRRFDEANAKFVARLDHLDYLARTTWYQRLWHRLTRSANEGAV